MKRVFRSLLIAFLIAEYTVPPIIFPTIEETP
jgi:hypothetical protein